METRFKSADELRKAAKAAGVKESRLDKAIQSYSLPEEGEFVDVDIVGGEYPHIVMVTKSGHKVSISTLQAIAHFGSKDTATFAKIEKDNSPLKGKFYLKGTTLNPHLSGDQAIVGFNLIGKPFKASKVEGYVLPFNDKGYTESSAKSSMTTKTFYKVEL